MPRPTPSSMRSRPAGGPPVCRASASTGARGPAWAPRQPRRRGTASPRGASARCARTQGLDALDRLLAQGRPQVAVLPIDWPAFLRRQQGVATPTWLAELVRSRDRRRPRRPAGSRPRPEAPTARSVTGWPRPLRPRRTAPARLRARAGRPRPRHRQPGQHRRARAAQRARPRLADGGRAAQPPRRRARPGRAAPGDARVRLPDGRGPGRVTSPSSVGARPTGADRRAPAAADGRALATTTTCSRSIELHARTTTWPG